VKSLSSSYINSISKRGNNESGSISEILITVSEDSIGNSELEVFLTGIVHTLELSLPLEFIRSLDILINKLFENISGVSIHGNHTHDFLSSRLVEITLDHENKAFEILKLSLIGFFDGIVVGLVSGESFLATDDPRAVVNQQTGLSWGIGNPLILRHLSVSLEGLKRDILQRVTHTVDNILKIALDLTKQFKFSSEFDLLFSDIRVPCLTKWSDTFFFEDQSLNGDNNFGHVLHNLGGRVTVGKNIQKISWGYEEESGESNLLGEHESVKSGLANGQLSLNLLQLREYPVLDTEIESQLGFVTISKNFFDVLIDINELLRFFGELFLYFFGVDEEILKERPGSLDLTNNCDDLTNVGQSFVPVVDLLLESSKVSVREHG
jgi:hypothetical protein